MARQTVVTYTLTDDLSGESLGDVQEGAHNPYTRSFTTMSGVAYTIDLSDDNAAKLAEAQRQAANNIEAARVAAQKIMDDAAKLAADVLAPFVDAATPVPVAKPTAKKGAAKKAVGRPQGTSAAEKEHRQQIRWWAQRHVNEFPAQGRIPGEVIEAYENDRDIAALTRWAHAQQKSMKTAQAAVPLFTAPAAAPVSAPPADKAATETAPEVPAPAAKRGGKSAK